jgi:Alpha galactosidase A/Alpha galactosidase C-terminal beta sandwich domain
MRSACPGAGNPRIRRQYGKAAGFAQERESRIFMRCWPNQITIRAGKIRQSTAQAGSAIMLVWAVFGIAGEPAQAGGVAHPTTFMRAAADATEIPVPRPPMGWSSWNSFSNIVDSNVVIRQAKAMVASGMQKHGYEYVNIDEGWWLGERDKDGNIVVDAKQWPALTPEEQPGDMANIVKYLHSVGLKAGIYTDAGKSGCSFYGPDIGPPEPNTGSEGHYEQDFLQFAKWGFDYVKVDWCGGNDENLDPAVQYAEIAGAIQKAEAATGHPLFYSICNWGKNSPWTWAAGIGGVGTDIWRTSGDIVAPIVANGPHSNRVASFAGMLSNFDQGIHPEAQHTGFYNDPDMMVLGMRGLTDEQNRVHMSLWAISGAPLLVGADLTTLSPAALALLNNTEVLDVDQDALGLQAVKIAAPEAGLEVWSKRLARGGHQGSRRAVVLLNRTRAAAPITIDWTKLGLVASAPATIRDAWAAHDLGTHTSSYTATVPAGDAEMLIIEGQEAPATEYAAAAAANELTGGAEAASCGSCAEGRSVALGGEKMVRFRQVKSPSPVATLQIAYVNGSRTTRFAQLRVNGQNATTIAFPPTGGEHAVGLVTIAVRFKPSGEENMLTFSSPCSAGPALTSVAVLAGGP